nr:retrovirus-related Pol polyprotein from transposon TNT 1-94 [Tanacetum cinerariifolium]
MVADLRYFNSLKIEVDSLKSQLETQKTQFLNEIDRLSREYYYADHMNTIFGVYTELDESKEFYKEQEQYFEIQDLKAQLQEKGITISELKKLIEKLKGKSVNTKFGKSSVTRQPNAFKSPIPSILGKPTIFSDSLERKDFSMPNSVTKNNVSNDFSKSVTAQTLPPNKNSILKNTNVIAPGIPKLKSNPMEDRVLLNNSQGKKPKVEDHHRNVKFSKNKTSVTAYNDSLNVKTSNKFLGTVKFGNDQIAPFLGYGDLVQGAVMIKWVYYVKGLNHNLFFVDQLCDADLEVSFWKSTCYIRDLKGNDLLTGSRGTDLYSITLQDTNSPNLICLRAKETSSQTWLWHRRLSHLNFDTINLLSKNDILVGLPKLKFVKDHLCSSCELGKAKRQSFQIKTTPSLKRRLQLLHMDLCGPMRVASINGKIYVLVIVDDYFRYTWTHFLRSKDETPEVLIYFLRLVQRGLHAQVRIVRTDKGTEFLNKTLHAYFVSEGILHQTSVAQTPEQNGVVERWNLIPRHEKTPYHIINDRKPSVKFFHIFGSLCYIVRDGKNLDKMKEKGDACIFVGYSTQSRAYRVFNKRTRVIVETIHVNFDELPQMASDHDVLMSSAVTTVDAPNKCQQHNTNPLNNHTTPKPLCHVPPHAPTVTYTDNMNQAEMVEEYAQVENEEFINIFCTLVQDRGETSSRHVDSSNMHTFYQHHPSKHRWTKDDPLEHVIGNPSQSVRTRRQLKSYGKMCMFALTMSRTEPKSIKEAMADSAWIESMQKNFTSLID